MFRHLNFNLDYQGADYSDLNIPESDREVLRRLAAEVKEISESDDQKRKKILWTKHNQLETDEPVILCDPENGWNEVITDDQIECKNSIARHWECMLRKELFWGKEMGDDKTIEGYFDIPFIYSQRPYGIEDENGFRTGAHDGYREDGGAYELEAILENYDQLKNIVAPKITVDYELSDKVLALAEEVFEGTLEVRRKTVWYWSVGITDEVVSLRGMEKLMFDFFDQPDGVHALMKKVQQGIMDKLDFLEQNHLLSMNNDSAYVGSGGIGWTNELNYDPSVGYVRLKDMWGLLESQVTVGISPDMFKEYIFPYQKTIMERYGLTCYGCCEPMDDRFPIVKQVSNLRRVSVSPWATVQKMSDQLKKDYILSLKLSPSPLAIAQMDEKVVRDELRQKLDIIKGNNIPELLMKDNHTLGGNPENLKRWCRIAREEIGK